MFVIGTLQPSCAVAKPNVAVPTFSCAGLHVSGKGAVTTVVVGIVAGLSIHGTVAGTADSVAGVADTFDDWDGEAVGEPQADKTAADMRRASDLVESFLLISEEV